MRLVHKRQFPIGTPYPDVVAYVAKAFQTFDFEGIYVDKTGIGDAVVDELDDIEVPNVVGVFFTEVLKENMLNYLKLLMEKKQLKLLGRDKQLISQINEQQYEYFKPESAQERVHLKFCHPRGRHDDQLYALALACFACKEAEPRASLTVVPRQQTSSAEDDDF